MEKNVINKRIIITGANGSLGKVLVSYFSKNNSVIAIARQQFSSQKLNKNCTYLHADINEIKDDLFADIIIHAAGLSDDKGKWDDFYHSNVLGTKNIVEKSKNIPVFIFISSSSVYLPSNKLIRETDSDTPSKFLSNYGLSKRLAENELIKKSLNKQCFILRPRALYGVGDTKIIPRMFNLYRKNKLVVPGSLKINVSLTHFDNLIHGIECCINSKKQGCNVYNISDENSYLLINFIRKLIFISIDRLPKEKHMSIWFVKLLGRLHLAGLSPLMVRVLTQEMVLDISKIKNELNYLPQKNLKNSLAEIGDWIKRNGGINSKLFKQD